MSGIQPAAGELPMKKPNFDFERREREKAKAAKKAEKAAAKAASKGASDDASPEARSAEANDPLPSAN
jgi:hypothetical protein